MGQNSCQPEGLQPESALSALLVLAIERLLPSPGALLSPILAATHTCFIMLGTPILSSRKKQFQKFAMAVRAEVSKHEWPTPFEPATLFALLYIRANGFWKPIVSHTRHCGPTPMRVKSVFHLSPLAFRYAAYSAGVLPTRSTPCACIFSRNSGIFSTATVSR